MAKFRIRLGTLDLFSFLWDDLEDATMTCSLGVSSVRDNLGNEQETQVAGRKGDGDEEGDDRAA